ncbi:reverse transcriptase, partial [Tanacetum coccineum]
MEMRNSTELKKILEIMEADKRDVAQQIKAMQDQIQELLFSNNQRTNGDSSSSGDSVNKEGNGSRHLNDIKVDIPEYDGKLDPDEFVEWLRTVELASFSQLHSLKQGAGTAKDYSREFEYLLMKCDILEDDPQTLVRYLGGLESRVAH